MTVNFIDRRQLPQRGRSTGKRKTSANDMRMRGRPLADNAKKWPRGATVYIVSFFIIILSLCILCIV